MSDLYLHLRHRLEAVAEWVTIGVDAFGAAQKQLGLSDERAARLVPVSVRTWIRWRQRGQVPIHSLDRVAQILELDIERASRHRVVVEEDADLQELRDHLDGQHEEVIRRLASIEEQIRVTAATEQRSTQPNA